MAFRLKYRISGKSKGNPVNIGIMTVLLELGVGITCLLFAYADWGNGKTMLFWPFISVAMICFLLVSYSVVESIYLKLSENTKEDS
jgi:hypothetical protein